MAGLTDDWDSVPVKAGAAKPSSVTSDWDAVPVKGQTEKTVNAPIKYDPMAGIQVQQKQGASDAVDGMVGGTAHVLTGIGSSIVGGYHGLATLASGGSLADAADAVTKYQDAHTYSGADGTASGKATAALDSKYNPMNYIGNGADYLGGKITDVTGSPLAGATVNAGINAGALMLGLKAGSAPILRGRTAMTAADLASKPAAIDVQTAAPQAISAPQPNLDIPTYLRKKQSAFVQQAAETVPYKETSVAPAQPSSIQQAPAVETAISQQPVFAPAYSSRAQVLKDVGLDTARESALSGNGLSAATDYQLGKFQEPAGQASKDQFSHEKNTLQSYGEGIVKDTGGTLGLDQDARLARGNTILAPLDGLKQYFDDATNKLYSQAKDRAQGQPVALNSVNDVLGQKSNFSGNTDTLQLRNGVTDRMGELGMLDKDSNVMPSTVEQAENLRKYLNEQWTPKNSRTISMLKDAIDGDVTSAAGDDVYKQARGMRAMRAVTLDDPNGISKLMDSNGPNGVNRKVQTENIASEIAGMPVAQFQHIIKTLQNVPPELQPQAQAALGELKAHFANRMIDAGTNTVGGKVRETWNHTGVSRLMNDNSSKFPLLFNSEEMGKISNLRDAGNILSVDTAYPGAAAQAANSLKRGMMTKAIGNVATMVGGGAGSVIGMPTAGAVAGRMIGEKMSTSMGEGKALKNFQKGTIKLSDIVP